MEKQLIISIGREFGSGGHVIAEQLAKQFNLPLYDHNLLKEIAKAHHVSEAELEKYDEEPKHTFFSRTVRGFSNSPEENIAHLQFDYIRQKAERGESFVIVGRCSEKILKDYKGMVSIFILGDRSAKIERVCQIRNISREEAKSVMERHDKHRKKYHNYYSEGKWGDSRNYDISINSSRLGIDRTAALLESYIKERMQLI